jgi:hypothetical protein
MDEVVLGSFSLRVFGFLLTPMLHTNPRVLSTLCSLFMGSDVKYKRKA